ncbi:MAG: DEAD/DEAH box helicase, partial [Candidatus Hydrogenedentota bacterium]
GILLDDLQIPYFRLDGSTTIKRRKKMVDAFQKGERPVFLISLRAGGSALTLTKADTVIHLDPWWNPAVENQATDRAHRIGQDKPVFVYKIISKGTLEEKVLQLQEKKRWLFDQIIEHKATRSAKITPEDIRYVLDTKI